MKKLYLLLMASVMMLAANAADVYLVGSEYGWAANAQFQFEEGDTPGVYVLDEGYPLMGQIKILVVDGGSQTWWGLTGDPVTKNGDYKLDSDGSAGNLAINGTCDDAKLTWNDNTGTLTIEGTWSENEYDTVYLVGDFGSGYSTTIDTHPLTLRAGSSNDWTGTYTLTAAVSRIKMRAGNNIYATGINSDVAITLGQSYTASMEGDCFTLPAGTYDFSFVLDKNADTGVLTVTGEPVYPANLYLATNGGTDNWTFNTAMTTQAPGIYTLSDYELKGHFFFTPVEGSTDWNVINGNRYGPYSDGRAPVGGALMDLYPNNGASFLIDNTDGSKYDIMVNLKDNKVEFTKIADPDAPVVDITGPDHVYVIGTIAGAVWDPNAGTELTKQPNTDQGWADYAGRIEVVAADGSSSGEIAITTLKSSDWSQVNSHRWATPSNDDSIDDVISPDLAPENRVKIALAPGDYKSALAPGDYYIHVYFTADGGAPAFMTLKRIEEGNPLGVDSLETSEGETLYFNLQGLRVAEPQSGIFIRISGGKAAKVLIRK